MVSPKTLITAAAVSPPVAKLVTLATGGRVPSGSIRIDLGHAAVDDTTRASVFWRLHERAEIGLIRKYISGDCDVVELGACSGVTGAHILDLLDSDHRLIAVEANPRLIGALQQALDDDRCTVSPGAIDYRTSAETVEFHVHPKPLRSRMEIGNEHDVVHVPRLTLSGILAKNRVDDFALVADIEGAEAGIIMKDPSALEHCRVILIELHEFGHSWSVNDLVAALEGLGFHAIDEVRNTKVFVRK